jgi:hypothetical protein
LILLHDRLTADGQAIGFAVGTVPAKKLPLDLPRLTAASLL